MLARLILATVVLTAAPTAARAGVAIHATCAADLARDPSNVRTLRGTLSQALADLPDGYALDVSLVRVDVATTGRDVQVRVEVRAMLSDKHRRVQWTSTARAEARGPARDRSAVQRDAVTAAAEQIAKNVRTRCK